VADLRGLPLAYVGLTIALWSGARILLSVGTDEPLLAPAASAALPQTIAQPEPQPSAQASLRLRAMPGARRLAPNSPHSDLHPAWDPWQNGGRPSGSYAPFGVAKDGEPLSTGRDTPPTNAFAPEGKAGLDSYKRRWGSDVYVYSFWRFGQNGANGLAPGAQYGGSQTGLILTVDPFGAPDRGASFMARLAATPGGKEKELALGLRWRPDAGWPIALSAERRFRGNGADSMAVYVAGGVNNQPVLAEWRLDAFGQFGYDSSRFGGTFFDGQARVTDRLGTLPFVAGAGLWTGGQRDVSRLDIGPTLIAKVETRNMPILIHLDWRVRVAGNANPKDGLALTVSTGF
jgi:hypothetical protein